MRNIESLIQTKKNGQVSLCYILWDITIEQNSQSVMLIKYDKTYLKVDFTSFIDLYIAYFNC